MTRIKIILEDIHHWVGNQSVIVQVGIAAFSAFVAVACLMAAFT